MGRGLWSCMWVDAGGWGSYRHPFALLSHCWSLWCILFTVLASVENRGSYHGSQCAHWPCGSRTRRRHPESQSRRMPWATPQEPLLRLVPCVTWVLSNMPPHRGASMVCSWFTGCSETQPGGVSKEQVLPDSLLVNQARFTHPVMLFKHVINFTVLGQVFRGTCSPFKHIALTVSFFVCQITGWGTHKKYLEKGLKSPGQTKECRP